MNASLYVVAFGNANGTSRFTMNPAPGAGWPFGAAGGLNVVPEDGSYGSLGNALGPFAQIMPGGLQNSVQTMSTFGHGGALGANERAALINLIIISSEAVRFTDVEDDVTHIIKGQSRTPSWANIHAWGGNTLPT